MSFTADLDEIVQENFNGLLSGAPDWPRRKLKTVAHIRNGIPLPSAGFNGTTGHPVARIRNVLSGTTATYFRGDVEPGWFITKGDLLVGMDGDFNCSYWADRDALLNQRVCLIKPREDLARKRFLGYILPGYLHAVNKHTSAVTVKHLSSKTLGDLPIPLPPPHVQDAIVSRLDMLIGNLEVCRLTLGGIQTRLKQARASILEAAVGGRLTDSGLTCNKEAADNQGAERSQSENNKIDIATPPNTKVLSRDS